MNKTTPKKRPVRILLVHVDAGGGHKAFKDIMIRALSEHEEIELKVFDTDVKVYESTYKRVLKIPGLWKILRSMATNKFLYYFMKPMAVVPDIQNAEKILEEFNPDIVITTNPLTSVVYYLMQKRYRLDFKLVTSVLDYGDQPNYLHVNEPADYYLVRDEDSREILSRYIDKKKLVIFGTSVHPAFLNASNLNQKDLEQKFFEFFDKNFSNRKLSDKKNILIMGGSNWAYKAKNLFKELEKLDKYNLFINCGGDKTLFESLKKNPKVFPFHFQNQETLAVIERFVDLTILSSLAPATMHELMTINKYPLFVHRIIQGQETPHISLIRDWKVGIYEPEVDKMISLIENFFTNPSEYDSMLENAKKIRAREEKKAEDNYKIVLNLS